MENTPTQTINQTPCMILPSVPTSNLIAQACKLSLPNTSKSSNNDDTTPTSIQPSMNMNKTSTILKTIAENNETSPSSNHSYTFSPVTPITAQLNESNDNYDIHVDEWNESIATIQPESINNIRTRPYSSDHENPEENRCTRLISNAIEIGTFSGNEYRFGEYYLYTPEFKNKDHYVFPKYKDIEEEAIANAIRKRVLNRTKKAAQNILNKMIKTCAENTINQDECFEKYGIRLYARQHQYYNKRYNIKAGQQICLRHLIAVKLYFDNTSFPSALRQTYWSKNKDENFEHIKQRHSGFGHTCRALLEAIYLYGNKFPKDKCVFRGVSQLTFAWFDATFAGPVSTSWSKKVASTFAGSGSVVQLESAENDNMYINGSAKEYNLSNHKEEKECLMWSPCLYISDVLFSLYKRQYVKSYVSAMLLFQKIVTGQLLNKNEEMELLTDNIQNTLNALIQWRITGNDDELMEFVKQKEIQRIEQNERKRKEQCQTQPNVRETSTTNNRSSLTRSKQHNGNTLSQSLIYKKTEFIKSLCGTVFENLFQRTQLFWNNTDVKLNTKFLERSIQILLTKTKGCEVLHCNALKWKVCLEDLESAPDLNGHYLKVDEYIKNEIEIIDKNLLKTFLECDKAMNCIREYFDESYAVDFKIGKCNVKYKNEMYTICPLLELRPTCTRPDNKYYDINIKIMNINNIKDINSLQWSFDILCDELDISMHFVDRYVKEYKQRQHTQIISNDDIRKLVNNKKDIIWHIAFRFHHSS